MFLVLARFGDVLCLKKKENIEPITTYHVSRKKMRTALIRIFVSQFFVTIALKEFDYLFSLNDASNLFDFVSLSSHYSLNLQRKVRTIFLDY